MPQPEQSIYEFEAIGTHWWLELFEGTFNDELRELIDQRVTDFNLTYTRFRDDSLVGKLNSGVAIQTPPREMREMMKFARELHEVSDGAFDISIGGQLHRAGYGERRLAADVASDFWQKTVINEREISTPHGSVIDFGGFGKGWLVDEIAALLERYGIHYFIVNGGGDMIVRSRQPVEIGLEHPLDDKKVFDTTKLTHGALASSSTHKRVWLHKGKSYHHIFDPLSGDSSDSPIIASFVRTDSCVVADAMATILILRPALRKTLEKNYQLQTILIDRDLRRV